MGHVNHAQSSLGNFLMMYTKSKWVFFMAYICHDSVAMTVLFSVTITITSFNICSDF